MRHLFFTNTPAHVHLYKHAVRLLDREGHDVTVMARDYGCTLDLLAYHDLPYEVYGRCGSTKRSRFLQFPGQFLRISRRAQQLEPDLVFGVGTFGAIAAAAARCRCVLVLDSEPTNLDHRISRRVADAILTPRAFEKRLGANHYEFDGFKESAYLHPSVFDPDPSVRDDLGLDPEESFAICRFNAFDAHHDVGQSGFSTAQREGLIERLAERATVLVSNEGGHLDLTGLDGRRFDLHPARIHDALAAADLLVADTQTMVTEAAMLGTPAVRSNSFVGEDDMGNFKRLEAAGLIFNYTGFEETISTAERLLSDDSVEDEWLAKRDDYVEGMVDLTDVIVEVARTEAHLDEVASVGPWSGTTPS